LFVNDLGSTTQVVALFGSGCSVNLVALLQEFSEPAWIYQKNVEQKKSRQGKKKNDKIN
jgi:hypothetical protein